MGIWGLSIDGRIDVINLIKETLDKPLLIVTELMGLKETS